MRELLRKLNWLFRRHRYESELDEEMRHHLEMKGQTGPAFGNLTLLKENSRAVWTIVFWEQLVQDIRYGFRTMASNRLFTAMAVLSLALGIGANTAIYSFLNAVLLKSLPVKNPGQLVILNWRSAQKPAVIHSLSGSMFRNGTGSASPDFPVAAWETLRQNSTLASSLFAYAPAWEVNLVVGSQAEVSRGWYVSGNFFSGLGVTPAAGRPIVEDDDRPGAAPVALISYKYWRTHLASDPSIVGRAVRISNVPFTVIGISPDGFSGVDSSYEPAFFLPLHAQPLLAAKPADEAKRRFFDKNFYWVQMMGRLKPGVTVAQAQTVYGALYRQFAESTAATAKERATLPELWAQEGAGGLDSLRRRYSEPLVILMCMVGLILAIACANIANLLLARAAARRREIAVRLSLGAGRLRVIRQLLTESVLMSLSGALMGLAIAVWAIRSITWLLSDGRDDMVLRATLDWPVLGFTAALGLVTGIVFGFAPALQATRISVTTGLKQAKIGSWQGRSRMGLSQLLVVAQISISLLLVVAAGLFVRTLANLHSVQLGFNSENLLIFSLNGRGAGYKDDALARFYAGLGEQFRHIPGVRSAGFSSFPLAAQFWDDTDIAIPGQKKQSASVVSVDPGFLRTMQIPVLLGREIEERDIAAPRAAVISQLFASKFFPGENPVGRHIQIGASRTDAEIVGIAKTTVYNSLREDAPPPVFYIPYTQDAQALRGVWFELRTSGDPLAVAAGVRATVHRAAAGVPIANLKTQAAQIDETISQERTFASLCTCFAFLALVIACVGLYGTVAYAAARRTSEIGIRMALGAGGRGIVWMMLRQVLVLSLVGLAIGLGTAWETAHFVASFLYGVNFRDPLAFWGSAAVLLAAALMAACGPARRAARVDPMVALRNE